MKNIEPDILIRQAAGKDLLSLERIAVAMQAQHEKDYFARCLEEQRLEKRIIFLAETTPDSAVGPPKGAVGPPKGAVGPPKGAVGYVQLNWHPLYPPFRRLEIPEVQDLNVVPGFRRLGIGQLLVETCENAARAAGRKELGIGVGLYARFGAAQRLYVARGYVPDGAGICHDDVPVTAGELRPVDDLLTLKLVKAL